MLVLTRKIGEVIRIGGLISVRVVSIGDGRVQLGIDAPRRINVVREELLEDEVNDNERTG